MENYNNQINNLYNKKQNFLEKEETSNDYTSQENANVMQCYVNQDNQLFIDNANVYQTEDGQIYYACLSNNDVNNQSVNIISQEQLSSMMIPEENCIDDNIPVQNYYTVPTSQLQYIKYEENEDFRNDSYFKYQECSICNSFFSSKKAYLKHMLVHENDRDHKCSWCKLSYNHEVNLLVHMAVVHTDECFDNTKESCLRCPICDCAFSRKKALQGHCLTHQVDEEVMCDHCSQLFKSRVLLKEHLIQVENGEISAPRVTAKLLRCKLCHEVFENVGKIKKHYAREHPKGKNIWQGEAEYTPNITINEPEFDTTNLSEESDGDFTPDKSHKKRKSSKRAIQTIKLYAQSKNKQSERDKSSGGRKRGRPRKEESTGNSKHGYSCSECGKNFKTPVLLRRHEVTHTGFKAFECHICKKRFTQKSSVKIHLEVHKNVKAFKCKHCYKTFTYEHNMKTHMRVVHKEHSSSYYRDTYLPRTGRRGRPRREPLKTFAANTIGDDMEISQYLWNENFAYHSNSNIYMPSTSVWDKSNTSNNCGILISEDIEKIDKDTGTIQVHELIKDHVTGFKRFRCRFCCSLYKNSSDLTRHLRIHLNEKPFICYICRKSFRLKSVLKTHYKSHWKLKEYSCETCGKSFNLKQTLRIHSGLHNPESLRHVCKFCDKSFNTYSHYKYHLATHQRKARAVISESAIPLEPVICDEKLKSDLIKDLNDKNEDRPFKCQYCSKSYKQKKYLQEHYKDHLDINKHFCSYCNKQFLTFRSLQQHLRVQHLNRARFSCTLCEAQFLTKSSLVRHGLVHSEDKPYMCPICKKRFKAKLYCERHIKKGNCQNIDNIIHSGNAGFYVSNTSSNDPSQSNIFIGNYIGNFNDYSNAQKYIVGTGDQSNECEQIYVTNTIGDKNEYESSEPQNYLGLLENSIDNSTVYTKKSEVSGNEISKLNASVEFDKSTLSVEDINNKSLADRFPILKASLFSEEDNSAKKDDTITPDVSINPDRTNMFFEGHENMNISDKLYHGCANCDLLFRDSDELALHVKHEHKLNKNYVCQVCCKAFSARLSLWAHSKTHEGTHLESSTDIFLTCIACQQQFFSVSSLSRHVRMQHNECLNLYRCNHCNKTYKTTRELDSHIKQMFCEYDALIINSNYIEGTNSNNSFVVRPKNEDDTPNQDVLVDLESVKLEQIANMDEKDINKASVKELIRAAREKTGLTKPRGIRSKFSNVESSSNYYECTICHKGFSRTSNLRQHLRVHTKSKPYQCMKCEARFRHRCSLKTHLAAKHSAVTKLLKCHLCSKFLRSSIALRSHMKMHLGKVERHSFSDSAKSNDIIENISSVDAFHTVDIDECKSDVMLAEDAKKLKCIYCQKTFDCMENYNNHECQYDIKQNN